jgi:hypothetical protein
MVRKSPQHIWKARSDVFCPDHVALPLCRRGRSSGSRVALSRRLKQRLMQIAEQQHGLHSHMGIHMGKRLRVAASF